MWNMADARSAWNDAGERLNDLGRRLRLHYDEQRGEDAGQTREELADAARRVGGAVQDAFEALGAAAKDTTVQADVQQVGQSLVDALGAAFGQASEELRKAFSERKGPVPATGTEPGVPEAGPASEPSRVSESGPASEPMAPGPTPAPPSPSATSASPYDDPGLPTVEPWGTP